MKESSCFGVNKKKLPYVHYVASTKYWHETRVLWVSVDDIARMVFQSLTLTATISQFHSFIVSQSHPHPALINTWEVGEVAPPAQAVESYHVPVPAIGSCSVPDVCSGQARLAPGQRLQPLGD